MSDIAKLYDQVMAGNHEQDKIASAVADDEGPGLTPEFFEKVANGDEEATAAIASFIAEAEANGASEDEIENAIAEAMSAVGVGEVKEASDDDEYEQAKAAAYWEGVGQAFEDVLESDLAKEAGVTADDLADFELGGLYATGYAEARSELDDAVMKIAAHKKEAEGARAGARMIYDAGKSAVGKGVAKAQKGGKRYLELMGGGRAIPKGMENFPGAKTEARKALAARLGTGAAGLGLAGGAYALGKGSGSKNKK